MRSGLTKPDEFYSTTTGKIDEVAAAPPTALEDASLSAWIKPVDGTEDIYYPKGSLAGLLLDIMIRDASDNQRSLDTVMREMYQTVYKRDHGGFTNEEWWQAVSRAAGGRSFAEFENRYVNGRDPYPWDSVLPLGGLRLMVERTVLPNLGISSSTDEQGRRVIALDPVGTGAAAGVRVGDYLVSVGGLDANDPAFGTELQLEVRGNAAERHDCAGGASRGSADDAERGGEIQDERAAANRRGDRRAAKSAQGTRGVVDRYHSTLALSRGAGPFHGSRIRASISLISRGARETHSSPALVMM